MRIALLLSSLALLCCASSVAQLPYWILNPPTKGDTLYAIGEGRSLQDSEQAALKAVLGQLRTRVSGRYSQQQQLVNDAFSETIVQQVESTIENLPISQYKVEKRHQEESVIYTLVSLPKSILAGTFHAEVEANLRDAQARLQRAGVAGSELEWWMSNKPSLVLSVSSNARYLDILSMLNMDASGLLQKNATLEQQLLSLQKRNCLFVKPLADKGLRHALREQVVAAGLPSDDPQCSHYLTAESDNRESVLFNQYTASLTMTVTLWTGSTALASEEKVETGQSRSSQAMANKAAAKRLVDWVRQDKGKLLTQLLSN